MMSYTVDDEICKAFAIDDEESSFYYTIFFNAPFQIGEPLPIFTSERLSSLRHPFVANHVTDPMSIDLISC